MRALVQTVSRASVTVAGEVVGAIGEELLILVGVTHAEVATGRFGARMLVESINVGPRTVLLEK